ncbi:MAG TPA: DUF302 domain-containing protein [Thermoguttaceae bacterium]|nr:DUF302 domain-containing protein [Thermoguttaceae bacterium]
MLYARESQSPIDEVVKKLEVAATENKFGILGVHDLKQKMNSKGIEFQRECRIFEVCNPAKAKTVLDTDMAISNALPCRISVYEEADRVKVSTIRPTALLAMFGRPELQPVAQEVEDTMIRIIDAACQ